MVIGFIHINYIWIKKINTIRYPAGYQVAEKLPDITQLSGMVLVDEGSCPYLYPPDSGGPHQKMRYSFELSVAYIMAWQFKSVSKKIKRLIETVQHEDEVDNKIIQQ